VKADALFQQLAAVLESCYLVIKSLVRQLLFKQHDLFLCGFMATPDMSAI
tara:strand:- start:13 stop:162 length:150 start_codon:yes stop_codon:yes gene_type:complete